MSESISNTDFHSAVAHLTDEEWLDVLLRSVDSPLVSGLLLPRFPPAQLQCDFVGSAGQHTLKEAYAFFREAKKSCASAGVGLIAACSVLDFGCGWGRITRFFSKDVHADFLFGVDVDPKVIELCRNTGVRGSFSVTAPYPPLQFADASFDIVVAYSVFSHLNEEAHLKWLAEIHRILRPGGVFIATTQGRTFIGFCETLRKSDTHLSEWERMLSSQFTDAQAALADYDAGRFLHSATGGGDFRPSTFYGETLIPPRYVERVWTRFFEIREFRDDRAVLPQAYIVARKPSAKEPPNKESRRCADQT
jgi:SAM-dependent methyltransferase